MFLLMSGDPEPARQSRMWIRPYRESVSLKDIFSWAADGYRMGKTWNENFVPHISVETELARTNWYRGFLQGLKENPRQPKFRDHAYGSLANTLHFAFDGGEKITYA